MTRTELSQKICEGITAVFGRAQQNPENWLYEQDYARGHVSVTEHAPSARDAMGICKRLEESIGCGVKVTSTNRSFESYVFTIDFEGAKNESKYSDGKKTLASIEQDGKTVITDGTPEGTLAVADPDKFVDGLNKVTGSRFRKVEEILDDRIQEASLALEGTGYTISRDEKAIRVKGPKSEVLSPICTFIPEGDEYFGSGFESDGAGNDAVIVVIPSEILGVEELLAFIDQAANSIVDNADMPDPKTDDEWSTAISAAEPDDHMARRFSFLKNTDGLSLALSDEKFAQAVASVRDVYGNDKAEAVLTMRLGARMARSIIERLGPVSPKDPEKATTSPNAFESRLDALHKGFSGGKASPGVSAIIAGNMVHRK